MFRGIERNKLKSHVSRVRIYSCFHLACRRGKSALLVFLLTILNIACIYSYILYYDKIIVLDGFENEKKNVFTIF